MPDVVFFADQDGTAPALKWLDALPGKVRDKFIVRIERLVECGSQLRRPEADVLRDGIYELRVSTCGSTTGCCTSSTEGSRCCRTA